MLTVLSDVNFAVAALFAVCTCRLNVVLSAMFGILLLACLVALQLSCCFLSVLLFLGTQPCVGRSTVFGWFETVSVHPSLVAEHQPMSS